MAPIDLDPLSGRFLAFSEREELALLNAQGFRIREIARRMGRSPSTISRELRRNAETRGGVLRYRATVAQWKAERAAARPKTAKLLQNARLRRYVQDRLAGAVADARGVPIQGPRVLWKGRRHGRRADRRWGKCWSPQQISRRLSIDFPHDAHMRISTKPSTRRSMCRVEAHCDGSCLRAFAPAGRCECRAPGLGSAVDRLSPLR